MAIITDIKRRILELAPAQFQEFCDVLLSKMGYGVVHGYGMKSGTGNTTKGNPDTYFRKENGQYVFVVYTTQQKNIVSKVQDDITKCLDPQITGIGTDCIDEIVCCHTSSNLSAGDDLTLHKICESKGITLTIMGLDEIANQVHNHYRSLAKDYLGLPTDTNQIVSAEEFVLQNDANIMTAPLNTIFMYRDKERSVITDALKNDSVVIITGKAGVGKTRLVLEVVKCYAAEQGYKLLCVKNNNLGLYEDLISATERPGQYLFFIDDANELAELSLILEYTAKEYLGYKVKVIVTVRDYAKQQVITSAKKYSSPQIIEIASFSDNEIKGFLSDVLEVRNEGYVKQIVRISEGNPRIAYMAGKLAIEKQNLSAIRDASQLYDCFYERYVNDSFGDDNDLCITAGILSVINAVILNNTSALSELLNAYKITTDTFVSKVHQLAKLEMVEIQLDQVAALSDQCIANYMLYYVFFQRKILALSDVLKIGFKSFRNGAIRAIDTILNLYGSEITRSYCRKEILKVWDDYKDTQDSCYEEFVKVFHVFRPEEAFLLAQNFIDGIPEGKTASGADDLKQYVFGNYESVLGYLDGYQNSDYIDVVIELLLAYCKKSEKALDTGYEWLEINYGINADSYKYEYYTQRRIGELLHKAVLNENDIAMEVGFRWAKYALGFSFRPAEMGRGNTFVLYNIEIKNSDGVRAFRHECWEILILLASQQTWHDRLLKVLAEYSKLIPYEDSPEIVLEEVSDVENLVAALDSDQISFLIVIQRLLYKYEKLRIESCKGWKKKLIGDTWDLYQLLRYDWFSSENEKADYENRRKEKIIRFGKNLPAHDIPVFVQNTNTIFSDSDIDIEKHYITEGVELILQQFDNECLLSFLQEILRSGNSIMINPAIALRPLLETMDPMIIFSLINTGVYSQKNIWLFGFFDTLPNERVSPDLLCELLNYLKDDSDQNITSSPYRNLRVLDKFLSLESNIYPIASSIIYEKKRYSIFIVETYFELLFHDQIYSSQELLALYKENTGLLQDIYFFMLKEGKLTDYSGTFLDAFLQLDESWIQKYSDVFWEKAYEKLDHDCHRTAILWKSDHYRKYFDFLFNHYPQDLYRWRVTAVFKDMLSNAGNDSIVKQRQQEWITHYISGNATNDSIGLFFDIVCELDDETRRIAIKAFLDSNSDYDSFKKLTLIPNNWSGNGSFIPAYQRQIDFLNSLLPIVSGIGFLRHRLLITEKIEWLRERIKTEEVEVIYRNLYM